LTLEDIGCWQVNEKGPEAIATLMDDREALLAAIRRLPADRRELLILKFVEQLTNAEIGAIMGRSEGAIKSLYHRTLSTLREDLHPAGPARHRFRFWRRRLDGRKADSPDLSDRDGDN
jgi:RNA polymerase sigma-70 factor (ECF subfamily)